MAQRRHHYESAFEAYLRWRRIPYVSVDEARKALLPEGAALRLDPGDGEEGAGRGRALKSFDFVLYGEGLNLLVDVKGRKIGRAGRSGKARLENWVTEDDIESLRLWTRLFGEGFEAAFVFVYWCDEQPPDALFQEIFEHRGRWYALRASRLEAYTARMTQRSPRWRTVHLSSRDFEEVSQPFAPAVTAGGRLPRLAEDGSSSGWSQPGEGGEGGGGRDPDPEPALHALGHFVPSSGPGAR